MENHLISTLFTAIPSWLTRTVCELIPSWRTNQRRIGMSRLVLAVAALASGPGFAWDANCYDQGDSYFIPAANMLEAKQKALVCFFAEISISSSVHENNESVKIEHGTTLEAKSTFIDWSGMRQSGQPGVYSWTKKDVQANVNRLREIEHKQTVVVKKEMAETWRPDIIKKSIISITSEPAGATVTLDGVLNACTTPCKKEMTNGTHTIVVMRQDFGTQHAKITVDNDHTSFDFHLKEAVGRIDLATCPSGSEILLDNTPSGSAPLTLKVNPGDYVISVVHPEYTRLNRKVSLRAGETLPFECTLTPIIGALAISAIADHGEPVHAAITIDGLKIPEVTPATITARVGKRHVVLTYKQQSWEGDIQIERSAVVTKSVNLAGSQQYVPSTPGKSLTSSVGWGVPLLNATAQDKYSAGSGSFVSARQSTG